MKLCPCLRLLLLLIVVGAFVQKANSQHSFLIKLEGLNPGDSATVIIQKSSEKYWKQKAFGNESKVNKLTFDLEDGKWAIVIDATGYTFPPATAFEVPENNSALVKLTPMLNENFYYVWQYDDSYVGHATQTYFSEPAKINVLDNEVRVPNDYSSIELRNKYGIILSNDIEEWTIEDSYRIYKMFSNLPLGTYGEGGKTDPATGENIRGIIKLSKDEQFRDLSVGYENGLKVGVISQAAFHYAEPQIVTVDGIKGKFFSKRLYHAVVNYITDFAKDEHVIDHIAHERFGIRFMPANQETENLMNEDASNFQDFFREEKIEVLSMFEELPEGFHKQEGLKYLVRRINGQPNPKYPDAAAIAWTGMNTIEFMDVAFSGSDLNATRRLILHEKTHFLWAYTFDDGLKEDWIEVGGWFQDPTSASGWSTYNTTEFVSPYAHGGGPDEDMAESVAHYLENPDKLMAVSVQKYEFIRDRVMHGTRYMALIREDLTFMVYNLFPDYTYPGKVKKVQVNVSGEPDQDKEVTIRLTLHSVNLEMDGAAGAYIRFASTTGTIHDIGFSPENDGLDSVLTGTTLFNKHEKSGYWTMASLTLWDRVGNERYENTSTVGMKLFIENPLEDISPPEWNYDLNLELVRKNFFSSTDTADYERELQAIKVSYSFYDDIPFNGSESNIIMSTPDKPEYESYFWRLGGGALIDSSRNYGNGYKSVKHIEAFLKIEEYMPSGYYSITGMGANDIANNTSLVYFVNDTSDFHIEPGANHIFKDVRDSIYVKTDFPDYVKPEIDVNNITVTATPTNPLAPDGETRIDLSFFVRDLSDFPGKESGVIQVEFFFRDPLGINHSYAVGFGDYENSIPDNTSDWKFKTHDFLLPKGSPPGKWGIAGAHVTDKAGNTRNYSFVEYVRFDVIESEFMLEEPLDAGINAKYINAGNVDNIDIQISCNPSAGLKYVYTIYSLSGGTVVRGEGLMTDNMMIIEGVNTEGVPDGVIKLTVQLVDSVAQLIAVKSVEYYKDTQRPAAYYTRANLQDEGYSNLDEVVFDIIFNPEDVGGTYEMSIESILPGLKSAGSSAISMTGTLNNLSAEVTVDLTQFLDKVIKTTLILTDTVLNVGDSIEDYYLVLANKLVPVDAASDYDGDAFPDLEDSCPAVFGNNNGCQVSTANIPLVGNDSIACSVFPNPACGWFSVKIDGQLHGELTMELLNPVGQIFEKRQVMIPAGKEEHFYVRHLSKGLYVIKLSIKNRQVTEKILIN